MAISDAEYLAWLSAPSAMRCVLVEANVRSGGSEITRYMSNKGYVTGASDTPANTTYRSIISGGVKLTESLALDSTATLSYGEIEIENTQGSLDTWLTDIWENRSVSVFYGDMKWARSDFRRVFKGQLSGISSQRRETLNLFIRDSLQRLNTPVTDSKLGGATSNKDRLIPLTFGECHNVSPLLIDPALHDYQVHNGAIEDIIEVRDNGAPITVTKTIATGKFRLANSPVGTITASVQGSKPSAYSNQIAENIKTLVKTYGTTASRLTDSDIDLTNFSTFAAANTAPIGLYLSDRTNLLDACQQLAGSVGAQVTMSRQGLLQLLRIDFPPSGTPTLISKKHIVEKSLSIDSKLDVSSAVQIGYCKNYTVENNLQTVIPEEHKSLYEQEWLTTTSTDSTVATNYRLLVEPIQKDTLLQVTSDATAEATRRLNIIKQPRIVYKMVCFSSMFNLTLGQAVTLTHTRFGLSGGVLGVVVGLEPDWMTGRITVKVMV
jgi:hypothetical protein